jgi:peptidoglycan/LPS O-acetylase OafA/YrhL
MGVKSGAKLDAIDGLRGLAVLGVIFFHLQLGVESHPLLKALTYPFRYGGSGIHLFFVLSGFCLAHSLIRREQAGRRATLGTYLKARWWRIAPPYYAALGLYLSIPAAQMLAGHTDGTRLRELTVRQVVTHLTFTHGFWPDTIDTINAAFWTLSLEFQFYLTLPFLMILVARAGVPAMVAVVFAASVAWRVLVAYAWPDLFFLTRGVFLGDWSEFAIGIAIAFWFNHSGLAKGNVPVLVLVSGAFLVVAAGSAERGTVLNSVSEYAFGLGYALLLIATLSSLESPGSPLSRCISWRPLVWTGMISYSLYLVHTFFVEGGHYVFRRLHFPTSLAGELIRVVSLLAAIMVFGWLFFQLIERHFARSVDSQRRSVPVKSRVVPLEA